MFQCVWCISESHMESICNQNTAGNVGVVNAGAQGTIVGYTKVKPFLKDHCYVRDHLSWKTRSFWQVFYLRVIEPVNKSHPVLKDHMFMANGLSRQGLLYLWRPEKLTSASLYLFIISRWQRTDPSCRPPLAFWHSETKGQTVPGDGYPPCPGVSSAAGRLRSLSGLPGADITHYPLSCLNRPTRFVGKVSILYQYSLMSVSSDTSATGCQWTD